MMSGRLKALEASILVILAASAVAIGLAESGLAYRLINKLGYPALCEGLFSEVRSNYYEVRRLPPPRTVKLRIINLKWIEENWGMEKGEDTQLRIEEDIYKALMIIPDDVSLVDVQRQQTLSILAAASGGEIYIVEDYFNPLDRLESSKVLAHELTHIVQGEYFPERMALTYDGSKAWTALIEGDASFTADKYAEYLKISEGCSASGRRGSMPPSIIELWLFPYKYGVSFVSYLYEVGGWDLVDKAYHNPPNTTEQILHPEKYLAGENFQQVSSPKPEGAYEVIRTDRFGEHFIRVFLSSHIGLEESVKASMGWNGDNFTYYRVNGESLFAWSIAWDTDRDRLEFHKSMRKFMRAVRATPLGNGTWKIGWRYLSLTEGRGNITYLEVLTGCPSPHEEDVPIGSEDLHRTYIILQGVQIILNDGGTLRIRSLTSPMSYKPLIYEKIQRFIHLGKSHRVQLIPYCRKGG